MLPDENKAKAKSEPTGKTRKTGTIRERLKKWETLALVVTESAEKSYKKVREIILHAPFKEIFDHLVYAVALDGRYLGNGKIQINNTEELYPWIINQHQNQLMTC